MTTNFKAVNLTNLQFQGNDVNSQMLRRLVTELVAAEKAINQLVQFANGIPDVSSDVPKHVLADDTGLGPSHTTSGLTAGQVLTAIGAAAAKFRQLTFGDLAQSDVSNEPEQNAIMQFFNGYWVAQPLDVAIHDATGNNEGMGAPVYINADNNVLNFRSLVEGANIVITHDGESITIASTASGSGGTGGGYPPQLAYAGIL